MSLRKETRREEEKLAQRTVEQLDGELAVALEARKDGGHREQRLQQLNVGLQNETYNYSKENLGYVSSCLTVIMAKDCMLIHLLLLRLPRCCKSWKSPTPPCLQPLFRP